MLYTSPSPIKISKKGDMVPPQQVLTIPIPILLTIARWRKESGMGFVISYDPPPPRKLPCYVFLYLSVDLNKKHCQRHNGHRVLTPAKKKATCIGSFGQLYVVPLNCISSKFDDTRWRYLHGHQMAPLALVTNLVTRWRHLH